MIDLRIALPEGFLEEEVRCGYVVTTQMKEVWAVELDLLCEFMRVCEKHNIRFYADSGTALGCVRHEGFIPWDDDIDLVVSRSNYVKLCEVAYEFKYPYFFQTEQTDPGVLRGHIQLRNSETTAILSEEFEYRFKYNQGIFIDIFPKDNIPDDDIEFERYIRKIFNIRNRLGKYKRILLIRDQIKGAFSVKKLTKNFVKELCSPVIKKLYKKKYNCYENLMTKYQNERTGRICNLPIAIKSNYKNSIIPSDFLYEDPIYFKFEFIKLPVPCNYDDILKAIYGDYMKFVIEKSSHGGVIFDTNISYIDFLKNRYE